MIHQHEEGRLPDPYKGQKVVVGFMKPTTTFCHYVLFVLTINNVRYPS